jgi:hypothetical protein
MSLKKQCDSEICFRTCENPFADSTGMQHTRVRLSEVRTKEGFVSIRSSFVQRRDDTAGRLPVSVPVSSHIAARA